MAAGRQGGSTLRTVEALRSELGAVETERGTVISLSGDVTFDFDKATIRPAAQATLEQLAELIQAGGSGTIRIEGHTDSRGDDDYNKRLSEARAGAVKSFLVGKGIDAARLETIGLGEARPVAPNAGADGGDDEAGRQRNRRVEVILPKDGVSPGQRPAGA
nr:OmpA family protein [Polymorphobacter multimanifer]